MSEDLTPFWPLMGDKVTKCRKQEQAAIASAVFTGLRRCRGRGRV